MASRADLAEKWWIGVAFTSMRSRAMSCLLPVLTIAVTTSMGLSYAPAARADAATPSAADREAARSAFAQGQHAFKVGDYRRAAESFEQAYGLSPHPDVLWNAARAWHKARELARAANLYAKFLRDAPANARDRNSATADLREISARLARIDVVAPDFQDLRVDGQPLEAGSVYVNPGEHVVEGKAAGHSVRQTPSVAPGDIVSVALVPPSEPPAAPPPPAPSTLPASPGMGVGAANPADMDQGAASHGWSPLVVVVGVAATVVAGGVTAWSAIDTQNARGSFDGSQQQLDDGLGKERRTNVLIAATAGLGALTLLISVAFVDWHKHDASVKVGVAPGGFVAAGRF